MNISVAIITKAEKINKKVLESVDFADEIVIVVDSQVKKPKTIGKKRIFFRPLAGDFASQRNFALSKVKQNWVLFVDDDEYVSTELKREIEALGETKFAGYLLKRIDVCFHQPLLHGETGHTRLLRLARKDAGKFVRPVHEIWKIKGETGTLDSCLFHMRDNLVSGFIGRMAQYGEIDSVALARENKPFSYWRMFAYPKAKFILNYKIKAGFLDGTAGLFSAYLMSIQSLTVRIFQWTKRN